MLSSLLHQETELTKVELKGSGGEKQISRMLSHYGIRFFYEHPVAVVDRGKVRVWYPDFWLPDYGVAIEYAGIVGNDDYAAGLEHKRATYLASGIPCVYVNADRMTGCWPKRVVNQIRGLLTDRLHKLDALAG